MHHHHLSPNSHFDTDVQCYKWQTLPSALPITNYYKGCRKRQKTGGVFIFVFFLFLFWIFFCFSWLLASVASGFCGFWLLWLLAFVAFGFRGFRGFCGFWLLWLLAFWPIHLSVYTYLFIYLSFFLLAAVLLSLFVFAFPVVSLQGRNQTRKQASKQASKQARAAHLWIWCAARGGAAPPPTPTKSALQGPQSTTPATKSALQGPQKVLRLPQTLHSKAHKVLHLPRNVLGKVHKVLHLPRNTKNKKNPARPTVTCDSCCNQLVTAFEHPMAPLAGSLPAFTFGSGGDKRHRSHFHSLRLFVFRHVLPGRHATLPQSI